MNNSSTSTPGDPIRALVCPRCGAPLEAGQAQLETITCAHCGIAFERSKVRPSGGVHLTANGSLTIDGDIIGGDFVRLTVVQTTPDPPVRRQVSVQGGDVHIAGSIVGGSLVVQEVVQEPVGRFARIRNWFVKLFRRPKQKE